MNSEEIYYSWANPSGPWSDWIKPALFSQAYSIGAMPDLLPDAPHLPWVPAANAGTALVLDLPDDASFVIGLALAEKGYQPVPLINTCNGHNPALNLNSIIRQLWTQAARVKNYSWGDATPPVFLLDARRKEPQRPAPGGFDNRWIVLPQDFPSAALMLSRGLHTVMLVQTHKTQPRDDLAHVMLRWQEAGMKIMATDLAGPAEAITIRKPRFFRNAWWALLAMGGLIRSSAGGFGGIVPTPSSSTG